jgi:hypothetical protein
VTDSLIWGFLLGPVWEGQTNALDLVRKNAAKFANHTNNSGGKTLAQHRKMAHICALFKAYTGELSWKSTGVRLKEPCYLSRDDHNCKIWATKQRTDTSVYSSINKTIKLWNQLPADTLVTFPRESHILGRKLGK